MSALKEKRITKRQLNPGVWLMFLSRSMKRQAGHDGFFYWFFLFFYWFLKS